MNLKNYFDDFTFNARVKPALTIVFPILLVCILKSVFKFEILETGVLLGVIVVAVTFGAYIIRELGKNYEEKMYKELGAKPTTIIFRLSDDRLNKMSKIRYHKWFNVRYKELKMPISIETEERDKKSDEKYASALDILRNIANSDRNKFPGVYQELKKYHYWRNLRGGKWYALLMYLITIFIQVLNIHGFDFYDLLRLNSLDYIIIVGMIVWSLIFCVIVSKKTVQRNAFDYAKVLVEVIEILDSEEHNCCDNTLNN